MKTYTGKADKQQTQLINDTENRVQSGGKPDMMFKDNRPESAAHGRLQKMADDSPRTSRLETMQETVNSSPRSAQLRTDSVRSTPSIQAKSNQTGLPDDLKSGVENLSGYALDDVKVHYNSSRPAQLNARAYAQGTDIHVAPGQEKHLSHEAWHVVQQKQGRVSATRQLKGSVDVNDDPALEREADEMGDRAWRAATDKKQPALQANSAPGSVMQRRLGFEFETGITVKRDNTPLTKKTPIGSLFGANWKVESDDDGRMEFIIHPPLEIDENLVGKLGVIFDEIEGICSELKRVVTENRTAVEEEVEHSPQSSQSSPSTSIAPEKDDVMASEKDDDSDSDSASDFDFTEYTYQSFTLNLVTGKQADQVFVIEPNNADIAANPQVTTGLTLDQLFNLKDAELEPTSPAHHALSAVQGAMSLFEGKMPAKLDSYGCDATPSDKLKGLLMLVAQYLRGGNQNSALSYPKEMTDGFALSRTNVSQLFKLIPIQEQVYFQDHPDQFARLALDVAGLPNTGGINVIKPGLQNGAFGPTRAAWLQGIPVGTDLLSHGQNIAYEGMGELGDKTEHVGDHTGNLLAAAGIFELRAGQTGSRDFRKWRAYAVDLANLVASFQKSNNYELLRSLNKNKDK